MPTTQKYNTSMLQRIAKAVQDAEQNTDDASGSVEIAVAVVDAFNANDLVIIDAEKRDEKVPELRR